MANVKENSASLASKALDLKEVVTYSLRYRVHVTELRSSTFVP